MVSGARTLVRTPIGSGPLLFPGVAHDTVPPGAIRLAPSPDHGLSWSRLRGRAMPDPVPLFRAGLVFPSLRIASFGRDNSIPSASRPGGDNSNPSLGAGRGQLNPLAWCRVGTNQSPRLVPGGDISIPRFAAGKWRNGRRARFRSVCPKGREGSTPSFPTSAGALFGRAGLLVLPVCRVSQQPSRVATLSVCRRCPVSQRCPCGGAVRLAALSGVATPSVCRRTPDQHLGHPNHRDSVTRAFARRRVSRR
jgi:hypothetical protein